MPETFRSQRAGTIADLIRQRGQVGANAVRAQGDAEAQRAAASGQAWGNAISNIGQAVSGSLADYANYRQDAPNRELRQRQSDLLAKQLSELETSQAQAKIGELASMVKASGYDPSTAEPIFRAIGKLSPDYEEPLMRALMDPAQLKGITDMLVTQVPGYKAPEGFSLSEGQTRFGPDGKPIASAPKAAPPAQGFTLSEGQTRYNPDGTIAAQGPPKPIAPTRPVPVSPGGRLVNPDTGELVYSAPAAPRDTAQEPLVAVMGDDGNPILLPRSQAQGRRPASSREQGRPVTSGDAGRVTDLDTSLDDLGVLRSTIAQSGSTGTSAAIGAAMPAWATDLFGWGASAKSKQAMIDRVKQVIGKALEEGVLRKEDEKKYEKILPTIKDANPIVIAKLNGLEDAIKKRKQRHLDSLTDAGYDTSRFTARPGTNAPKGDAVDALIKKYGGGE